MNKLPNFVTGFVYQVENAGILTESDINFVDESNKIRYFLLPGCTLSSEDSGVTLGFLLETIELQMEKFILIKCKFQILIFKYQPDGVKPGNRNN